MSEKRHETYVVHTPYGTQTVTRAELLAWLNDEGDGYFAKRAPISIQPASTPQLPE